MRPPRPARLPIRRRCGMQQLRSGHVVVLVVAVAVGGRMLISRRRRLGQKSPSSQPPPPQQRSRLLYNMILLFYWKTNVKRIHYNLHQLPVSTSTRQAKSMQTVVCLLKKKKKKNVWSRFADVDKIQFLILVLYLIVFGPGIFFRLYCLKISSISVFLNRWYIHFALIIYATNP